MTLLQKMERERQRKRELLREEVRCNLRRVLCETLPCKRVILFGSITRPSRFNEWSDIDLALESEPREMSLYSLTGLLSERLGRGVDVLLLPETRLRDKILREGELWTLRD